MSNSRSGRRRMKHPVIEHAKPGPTGPGWVYLLAVQNPDDPTDISIGGVYPGELDAIAASKRVPFRAGLAVMPFQVGVDMFPTYTLNKLQPVDEQPLTVVDAALGRRPTVFDEDPTLDGHVSGHMVEMLGRGRVCNCDCERCTLRLTRSCICNRCSCESQEEHDRLLAAAFPEGWA